MLPTAAATNSRGEILPVDEAVSAHTVDEALLLDSGDDDGDVDEHVLVVTLSMYHHTVHGATGTLEGGLEHPTANVGAVVLNEGSEIMTKNAENMIVVK